MTTHTDHGAAEPISGQPTHVAILRAALGGLLGAHTEEELNQLELGIAQLRHEYGDSDEAETGLQLLAKVRAFIEKHRLGCPESLFQFDNPQIDALNVMGDLCELAGWQRDEDEEA